MNKRLSIAVLDFDDTKNPLLSAGQAHATKAVFGRLAARNHRVTVYCSRYPGSADRCENGVEYRHIALGSGSIRLNNAAYIAAIPFVVPGIRADVIFECFTAPVSTLLSPLYTNIPVIAIPTSFEAEEFTRKYRLPFRTVERTGLRAYRYFLPYTAYYAEKMRQANPRCRCEIVPEGVGYEYLALEHKTPRYILFLGRFDIHQKGLDLLLKAYAAIRKDTPVPLYIAGTGPDTAKLKSLIGSYRLGDAVNVLGPAYGEDKFRLLEEAYFVAFPSRHEGFSLFSLEALASGNPLVAYNIPGLAWAGADVCLKSDPEDTAGFAGQMKRLVDDAVLRNRMGTAAKKLASTYTWDAVAEKYENFICSILEGREL